MNHKIITVITVAGLLISPLLYAQKKVYSLELVWQKTLNQYPSLSSKKYKIERQELNKNLIKRERLPEVNFQAQQSYDSYQGVSGAFFPLPGNYNTSGSAKDLNGDDKSIYNVYASAVLQWNFLQFGRIKSKLNVADAAIQLSNTALSQGQSEKLNEPKSLTAFSAVLSISFNLSRIVCSSLLILDAESLSYSSFVKSKMV